MKDTLVYHHSANPSAKHQAQQIVAQHLKEPTIKQAGAYHYVIESDGLVVQLHEETFIGYHAGNWRYNPRSIGICLAGDFTKHQPTASQLTSLTKLTMELQTRWGIPDQNIKLHKEVRLNPTACPGIDLRALYIEQRRTMLEMKLRQMEHALPRQKELRRNVLTRAIERLKTLLGKA